MLGAMLKIYYGTHYAKYVVKGEAASKTQQLIKEALAKGGGLVEVPSSRGKVFLAITPGVELQLVWSDDDKS